MGRFERLGMFKVLFRNESPVGKSLSRQFANGGPGIEDRLLAGSYWVRQISVVALKIKPFQALKASDEP